MDTRVMSWDQYQNGLNRIVDFLKEEDFHPEIIIGIARGGLVLLPHLSHVLECEEYGIVKMKRTVSDEPFSLLDERVFTFHGVILPEHLPHRILIVDDIVGYGYTMEETEKILRNYDGGHRAEIRKTALVVNEERLRERNISPDNIVDFYCYSTDKSTWIIFPWETVKH